MPTSEGVVFSRGLQSSAILPLMGVILERGRSFSLLLVPLWRVETRWRMLDLSNIC